MLDIARDGFDGELLAMIDPRNEPSQRLAGKLGFEYWRMAEVGGFLDQIWSLHLP